MAVGRGHETAQDREGARGGPPWLRELDGHLQDGRHALDDVGRFGLRGWLQVVALERMEACRLLHVGTSRGVGRPRADTLCAGALAVDRRFSAERPFTVNGVSTGQNRPASMTVQPLL